MEYFGSDVPLLKETTAPCIMFEKWNPHAFRAASAAPMANET
jgi:hypothetical protein